MIYILIPKYSEEHAFLEMVPVTKIAELDQENLIVQLADLPNHLTRFRDAVL